MKNLFNSDQEFRFNQAIFANRNKEYGAYVIRNNEELVLQKSLFIGVALFFAIAATPTVLELLKSKPIVDGAISYPAPKIFEIINDKDPVIPEKTKPTSAIKDQKTVASIVPIPAHKPVVETAAPSNEDLKKGTISTVTNDNGTTTDIYKPIEVGPIVVKPIVTEKIDKPNNDPVIDVDEEAQFSGGINAFREKVGQNFDASDFEGIDNVLKANVVFIVEIDGSITAVNANGNNADFNKAAEKAIKSIKNTWLPAKVKGKPVRSYFKIPISMQFE